MYSSCNQSTDCCQCNQLIIRRTLCCSAVFSGRPCGAECLSVGWCVANSQFTEPLRYRHLLLFPRNLLPCLLLISYYVSFSSSVPSVFFSLSLSPSVASSPASPVVNRCKFISHSQRANILCVWCLCHMSERGPKPGHFHAFAVVNRRERRNWSIGQLVSFLCRFLTWIHICIIGLGGLQNY